jgi:hypothetical protein
MMEMINFGFAIKLKGDNETYAISTLKDGTPTINAYYERVKGME